MCFLNNYSSSINRSPRLQLLIFFYFFFIFSRFFYNRLISRTSAWRHQAAKLNLNKKEWCLKLHSPPKMGLTHFSITNFQTLRHHFKYSNFDTRILQQITVIALEQETKHLNRLHKHQKHLTMASP